MSNRKVVHLYLCDGEGCSFQHDSSVGCYKTTEPDTACICRHTTDINHAIHKGQEMRFWQSQSVNEDIYIETEQGND